METFQSTNMQTTNLPASSRQAYLDWLRILAILGVLYFHSSMAFASDEDWHIKNPETSNLLREFIVWITRFRMPLLFFISGTVAFFILDKKSGKAFIGLRFLRLFIPLVIGMLVIVPPQVYLERVTQGFKGNFFEFYPSIFTTGPYPAGNLSWHHLWFILYLFIYDVLCTPLFVWLKKPAGKTFLARMNWMAKGKWIYLITIPSILLYITLNMRFPATNDLIHDYFRFFYWLLFLLAGFICIAQPLFMDSLERNRRTSLAIAFLTLLTIYYIRWNGLSPYNDPNYLQNWTSYAYQALYAITAWGWVLAAIGYGKKYLNCKHASLDYLNQTVYPFYILHQTVIIILVFYVVQTPESILAKYLFTSSLTLFITVLICHLFIRPFPVMRFLFGMKPKKPAREEKPAVTVTAEKMNEQVPQAVQIT